MSFARVVYLGPEWAERSPLSGSRLGGVRVVGSNPAVLVNRENLFFPLFFYEKKCSGQWVGFNKNPDRRSPLSASRLGGVRVIGFSSCLTMKANYSPDTSKTAIRRQIHGEV